MRHEHSTKTLCRVLKVNRSSYYKHFFSPPAKRTLENQDIRRKILTLYVSSGKRLGVRKIRQRLMAEYGLSISVGRVQRLMKSMELPKISTFRPVHRVKKGNKNIKTNENLLGQKFNPDEPNKVWCSDITYISTAKGFCYLCVIIDLFARKIVAWRVHSSPTSKLVEQTLQSALKTRGQPKSVIFHSDRGTQYMSKNFRRLLDEVNFVQSISAPGCPYDNAVVESFFKYLKKEEINRRKFSGIEEVKSSVFNYIEGFYNPRRPHGANDGLSPNEREAKFYTQLAQK